MGLSSHPAARTTGLGPSLTHIYAHAPPRLTPVCVYVCALACLLPPPRRCATLSLSLATGARSASTCRASAALRSRPSSCLSSLRQQVGLPEREGERRGEAGGYTRSLSQQGGAPWLLRPITRGPAGAEKQRETEKHQHAGLSSCSVCVWLWLRLCACFRDSLCVLCCPSLALSPGITEMHRVAIWCVRECVSASDPVCVTLSCPLPPPSRVCPQASLRCATPTWRRRRPRSSSRSSGTGCPPRPARWTSRMRWDGGEQEGRVVEGAASAAGGEKPAELVLAQGSSRGRETSGARPGSGQQQGAEGRHRGCWELGVPLLRGSHPDPWLLQSSCSGYSTAPGMTIDPHGWLCCYHMLVACCDGSGPTAAQKHVMAARLLCREAVGATAACSRRAAHLARLPLPLALPCSTPVHPARAPACCSAPPLL